MGVVFIATIIILVSDLLILNSNGEPIEYLITRMKGAEWKAQRRVNVQCAKN